jgi:phosphoribosylaminoimidazolecarboxamide formyltransferase / IMP cyclohydrolase
LDIDNSLFLKGHYMPIALLSVYHKEGIVDFARELAALGWDLLASGGTATALRAADLRVRDVADLVGGGAILGHRVVTLSREVHAGLLARMPEDKAEMNNLGLSRVDLVCVDMYPLRAEINRPGSTLASVITQTDIGGPTMLRSGAKGNRIVICDPDDRMRVVQWLKDGMPDALAFVNDLAAKAEFIVSGYCLDSARYRSNVNYDGLIGEKVRECCYGENRHQSPAALFASNSDDPLALDRFDVIQGSDPSYVNWRDVDRLLQTVTHIAAVFDKNHGFVPRIAVGCKHGNPCGAAFGTDEAYAVIRMAQGDPLALFGGIVMANFAIDSILAEVMLTAGGKRVLDGVVAPLFDASAIEALRRKNDRCRLYQNPALAHLSKESLNKAPMIVPVRGGFLRQPNYTFVLDRDAASLEKNGTVPENRESDLLLAWAVGSTSNSNTVTLVKDRILIGNGVGQQDRVGACDLAVRRAERSKHDTIGSVAYSDSFFPFTDAPQRLADAGVAAILTSSGSVNDQKVRDFCAEQGIALWMIPDAEGRGFFGH